MGYASIPLLDAVAVPADPNHPLAGKLPKLKIGDSFRQWLSGLSQQVDTRPARTAQVNLQLQAASIATTPIPITDGVAQGLYRVSIAIRVTRPATATSAIQGFLTWTERGVVQIESMTNLVANLTTTREGRTFVIRSDASQPISYSTTYATTGATAMQYSLDIVSEILAADL